MSRSSFCCHMHSRVKSDEDARPLSLGSPMQPTDILHKVARHQALNFLDPRVRFLRLFIMQWASRTQTANDTNPKIDVVPV